MTRELMPKGTAWLLAFVLLFSCGCKAPETVRAEVKGNKTVGMWKGQTLKLVFEANATTGYLWELADQDNKGVVTQVGKFRYVHKERGLVGSGGLQIFRCEGTKRGKAKLVFEYRRPWEKNVPPAERYVVRVIVH